MYNFNLLYINLTIYFTKKRNLILESSPGDKSYIFLVLFNERFLKVKLNSFSINSKSFNLKSE